MITRAALSSMSTPSLVAALLLPSLSFPAFAQLSDKCLSLARSLSPSLIRHLPHSLALSPHTKMFLLALVRMPRPHTFTIWHLGDLSPSKSRLLRFVLVTHTYCTVFIHPVAPCPGNLFPTGVVQLRRELGRNSFSSLRRDSFELY